MKSKDINSLITKNEFDVIFQLGKNFFSQGKQKKALIIFRGLFALNPKSRKTLFALGETLLKTTNFKQALNLFCDGIHEFNDDIMRLGALKAAIALDDKQKIRDLISKNTLKCRTVEYKKKINTILKNNQVHNYENQTNYF